MNTIFQENQQPLGTKFQSYELTKAINHYTLDPFQYSITKFDYNFPTKPHSKGFNDFKNDPGLIYKDIDFEKLLPAYTQTKKSVNDFRAQDYHRFEANNGYFNPKESIDNSDLWYYGAAQNAQTNGLGIAGAPLNVQEVKHIIFPEPQRGGLNTQNLAKYSSIQHLGDKCEFFDYNLGYKTERKFNPYQFDSNYCRDIGISAPFEGSMPFNPK